MEPADEADLLPQGTPMILDITSTPTAPQRPHALRPAPGQQQQQHGASAYGGDYHSAAHPGYNPYQQHPQAHQQQWQHHPAAAPPMDHPPASQDPLAPPTNGSSSPKNCRSVPPPGSLTGSNASNRGPKAAPGTNMAVSIKAKPAASRLGGSSLSSSSAADTASMATGSNMVPLGTRQSPYLAKPAYVSVSAKPAGSMALASTTGPKVAVITLGGSGGAALAAAAQPDLKRVRAHDYDCDFDDDSRDSPGSGRQDSPLPASRRSAGALPAWPGGKAFQVADKGRGPADKEPGALDRALGVPYSLSLSMSEEERAKRAKRIGRFEDVEGAGCDSDGRYNGFADRFAYQQHRRALIEEAADDGAVNWADFVVKGTCKKLEKSYFRLTSAPNPVDVRPPGVLQQALQRLVGMIAAGERNYLYYNDQFKALRQDCTVQQVRDDLAVQVYEAHGRAALEYGDMAEYNQCQTQLAQLYADGQPGAAAEFAAYKVLYQAVHARHGEVKALMGTMRAAMGDEVGNVSDSPAVLHALKVRAAIAGNDWTSFFQLYAIAPNLGQALMDLHVPRMRFLGINYMAKAFRPSLPLTYLTAALGFQAPSSKSDVVIEAEPSSSGSGVPAGCSRSGFKGQFVGCDSRDEALHKCLQWATACKAVFDGEVLIGPQHAAAPSLAHLQLNCKDSISKLEMPPDTEKVAHGDAKLGVTNFFFPLMSAARPDTAHDPPPTTPASITVAPSPAAIAGFLTIKPCTPAPAAVSGNGKGLATLMSEVFDGVTLVGQQQ